MYPYLPSCRVRNSGTGHYSASQATPLESVSFLVIVGDFGPERTRKTRAPAPRAQSEPLKTTHGGLGARIPAHCAWVGDWRILRMRLKRLRGASLSARGKRCDLRKSEDSSEHDCADGRGEESRPAPAPNTELWCLERLGKEPFPIKSSDSQF